jgi:hypothetical protein
MLKQSLFEECAGETITAVHMPSNETVVFVFASGRFVHIDAVGTDVDGGMAFCQLQDGDRQDPTDESWQETGIFTQEEIDEAVNEALCERLCREGEAERQERATYERLRAKFEGK